MMKKLHTLSIKFYIDEFELDIGGWDKLSVAGQAAGGTGQLLSGVSSIAKLFGWGTRSKDEKKMAKLQNKIMEMQISTEEERKARQRNIRNYTLRGNW